MSPCFWGDPLQTTDEGAPIWGDPPTDESENNVEHCGSPAGSSGWQAWHPGALCLLRQVERISWVEHFGSPEIKICPKWRQQRVLKALENKYGEGDMIMQKIYFKISIKRKIYCHDRWPLLRQGPRHLNCLLRPYSITSYGSKHWDSLRPPRGLQSAT